jgi:hypothetical protein
MKNGGKIKRNTSKMKKKLDQQQQQNGASKYTKYGKIHMEQNLKKDLKDSVQL